MAEHDPISRLQAEKTLQYVDRLSRLGKTWDREYHEIKKPDEAFRLEKRGLESKLRSVLTDARNCVQDPRLLARLDIALEHAARYIDGLRVLDPGCGCKTKERQETYDRQVKEHLRKFPFPHDVAQAYAVRSPPASLAPGSTSSPVEGNRSSPRSAGPEDETAEDSTDTPVFPQPGSPFPPTSSGGIVSQAASPEPEHDKSGRQHAAGPTLGSSEDGTHITVVGDGTAADGIPNAVSTEEVQHNKRKGTDTSLMYTFRLPKRMRLDGALRTIPSCDGEHDEASSESQPDEEDEPVLPPRRTIEFYELYQDGNAIHKHFIVTYEDRYYILRCDEHELHFGDNPMRAAATHLNSNSHSLTRDFSVAIKTLGIEVLGCDPDRKKQNNDAFVTAIEKGYLPLGNRSARNRPQLQRQRPPTVNGRSRDQQDRDDAILYPIPGGIYRAYWQKSRQLVAVIVLPRGCFGDPSFSDVGLPASLVGSLAEDTFLMNDVPECYRFCQDTGQITGWEEGYEDGGDRVENREYPVMYFDGVEHMQKTSVAWMPAKYLRAYDRDGLAGNGGLISNYTYLRQFETRRDEVRATAQQHRELLATEDETFSDIMEIELPQPGTSSPLLQATEIAQEPPETTAPNGTIPSPLDLHNHPVDAIPIRGDPEPNPPSRRSTPPGPSTTTSSHPPPFSSTFRPNQEVINVHATTQGDWVPPQNPSVEGTGSLGDNPGGSSTEGLRDTASAALIHDRGRYASLGSRNAALAMSSIPSTSYVFPHVTMLRLPDGPSPGAADR